MPGKRKARELPDYFTMEEAQALIQATDSAETKFIMRLMLRCGLRVSEALALRPSHLRLEQDPPIIVVPVVVGNKAKKEREVPIPADIVEFVRDRASGKTKALNDTLVSITARQTINHGMKRAARVAGIDPDRAKPHSFRHTYGRHCADSGVPVNVFQEWMGHSSLSRVMIYTKLGGTDLSKVNLI